MISRPLPTGCPEVPAALDQVALVEVVGPDAHLDQLLDEVALDVHTVVDAGEQHRLVAQRDAGAGQLVAGAGELGGDLVRVVDVDVQPQRVVLAEHLAQLVVDALGQNTGTRLPIRMISMCGSRAAADDRFEELRGERQAVATEISTSRIWACGGCSPAGLRARDG